MKETSTTGFGLLIAFVVPGFTALWGASFSSQTLASWLTSTPDSAPTVGGFLYTTIASIAAGLTVSTVRWALIDKLHHLTGIPDPRWNFSRLADRVAAYDVLQENHYRFYQFYGNMLVAVLFFYFAARFSGTSLPYWFDAAVLMVVAIFYFGSRDTLRKYYQRGSQVLHAVEQHRTPSGHKLLHGHPKGQCQPFDVQE